MINVRLYWYAGNYPRGPVDVAFPAAPAIGHDIERPDKPGAFMRVHFAEWRGPAPYTLVLFCDGNSAESRRP